MKISIQPNSVTIEEIGEKINARFPAYGFRKRSAKLAVVRKTSVAGANILLRKNKIIVSANFPTYGGIILFVLSILLLGVLIPFIVYLAVFFAAQKKVEKEVAAFLTEEYVRQG